MPLTYGLTHLALFVKDTDKTRHFYQQVFDMEVMYHYNDFLQLTTPNCKDILVFEKKKYAQTGYTGSIVHFGFRLKVPTEIGEIIKRVSRAGGIIKSQGEFVPGSPYVFFFDPDGYEVEVWYEHLK